MKKTVILLSILVLLVGGCSSKQKSAIEILPEELKKIPFHTTNYRVYCGSDSLYHYFRHYHLKQGVGNYKISRDKLFFVVELPYNEKKPEHIFFSLFFDEAENMWYGDFYKNDTIN